MHALQLLTHFEDATFVADPEVLTKAVAAAEDARIFQMHVRTLPGLIRFNVLPSHFPHFMTLSLRKRLTALFASHVDGALNAPLAI